MHVQGRLFILVGSTFFSILIFVSNCETSEAQSFFVDVVVLSNTLLYRMLKRNFYLVYFLVGSELQTSDNSSRIPKPSIRVWCSIDVGLQLHKKTSWETKCLEMPTAPSYHLCRCRNLRSCLHIINHSRASQLQRGW